MTGDEMYLEVLAEFAGDHPTAPIRGYILRGLSIPALGELAVDLASATDEGRNPEDVLAMWEMIRDD